MIFIAHIRMINKIISIPYRFSWVNELLQNVEDLVALIVTQMKFFVEKV